MGRSNKALSAGLRIASTRRVLDAGVRPQSSGLAPGKSRSQVVDILPALSLGASRCANDRDSHRALVGSDAARPASVGSCFAGRPDCAVPPQAGTACPVARRLIAPTPSALSRNRTQGKRIGPVSCACPPAQARSMGTADWCAARAPQRGIRLSRPAWGRAGGATRTRPDRGSPCSGRTWPARCAPAARACLWPQVALKNGAGWWSLTKARVIPTGFMGIG